MPAFARDAPLRLPALALGRRLAALAMRDLGPLQAIALAVACTAVAVGLNLCLQEILGGRAPLLPAAMTILLVGGVLGLWPGMLALLLLLSAAAWTWPFAATSTGPGFRTLALTYAVYGVTGVCGVVFAASGRRVMRRTMAMQAALQLRDDVHRTLAEAFPDIVWTSDAQGRMLYVNPNGLAYTGLTLEQLQSGGWVGLHHPDDLPELQRVRADARTDGGPVETQFRYRRHDGEYRWFWTRAVPLRDGHGTVIQWLGTSTDITERLETERRAERLAALVDATPDFVAVMRPDATLTYMNPAGRRMVGLPDGADIGRYRHLQFSPAWQQDRILHEWMPVALRDGSFTGEGALRTLAGHEIPVSFVILVHRNESGTVESFSTYARDIRDQREAAERMRLESRRKDEFLATLAHELRNPMAPIGYVAELLTSTATPEQVERCGTIVRRQSAQMARLLDDLLDVSRISRDIVALQRDALDLREVLRGAVDVARISTIARRQRLLVSMPEQPVVVDGDPARLSQIVVNLLDNASKYTPVGGRIDLSLTCSGEHAVVRVTDDGIGLTPEDTATVFELFRQAGTVEGAPRAGLGIGLALVKRLVELHGGSTHARSDGPGRGSQFEVRLPRLCLQPAPVVRLTAPEAPRAALDDRPRVLVVDDNRDAAESLAELLRAHGFPVIVALDGASAERAFLTSRPSIVLLDLGLPDTTGEALAVRLGALATTPVRFVAISGWGQARDRDRTRDAGFAAHFVKPVDFGALMGALEPPAALPQAEGP